MVKYLKRGDNMSDIVLLTDTDCDISNELIRKHNIKVISLYVTFKGKSYKDAIEITSKEMYEMVDKEGELAKTAAASPGDFEKEFKKYLDQGKKILYIAVSSKLSATYNNARIAKELLESDDIYLLDSLNISSGMAILVLKAADFIKNGDDIEKVYNKVNELIPKVKSQFVLETLEYLYKGGRLNALSNFMGSVLKIKPIIRIVDGKMGVGKKSRGKMKFALDMMINDCLADKENIDYDYLFIPHSEAYESYKYVAEKLKNETDIKNIYEAETGCGISCHCGRGTLGIIYLLR